MELPTLLASHPPPHADSAQPLPPLSSKPLYPSPLLFYNLPNSNAMVDWTKLLASVIVATSAANQAIVEYFNDISSNVCKYAHEKHIYSCPAMVQLEQQQQQQPPPHRSLNIPDKPVDIELAAPQPLPKTNSTLYNTFDDLMERLVQVRFLNTRH